MQNSEKKFQKLTVFEERLARERLAGATLLEIAERRGYKYGTVRNIFSLQIYRKLRISLTCQLGPALCEYEQWLAGLESEEKELIKK